MAFQFDLRTSEIEFPEILETNLHLFCLCVCIYIRIIMLQAEGYIATVYPATFMHDVKYNFLIEKVDL